MMGEETFHPDTRALLAYGRALAGAGAPPKKGGADQVLERLFVIERTKDGRLPIRTFGADSSQLFGRDLKEHDFARFFLAPDLVLVNALIEACNAAGEPGIARVTGETARRQACSAPKFCSRRSKSIPAWATASSACFNRWAAIRSWAGKPIQSLRLGSLHPPAAKTPKGDAAGRGERLARDANSHCNAATAARHAPGGSGKLKSNVGLTERGADLLFHFRIGIGLREKGLHSRARHARRIQHSRYARCEHHLRRVLLHGDPLRQRDAVKDGHVDVGENEIDLHAGLKDGPRFRAIRRFKDNKAGVAQMFASAHAKQCLVLDD